MRAIAFAPLALLVGCSPAPVLEAPVGPAPASRNRPAPTPSFAPSRDARTIPRLRRLACPTAPRGIACSAAMAWIDGDATLPKLPATLVGWVATPTDGTEVTDESSLERGGSRGVGILSLRSETSRDLYARATSIVNDDPETPDPARDRIEQVLTARLGGVPTVLKLHDVLVQFIQDGVERAKDEARRTERGWTWEEDDGEEHASTLELRHGRGIWVAVRWQRRSGLESVYVLTDRYD